MLHDGAVGRCVGTCVCACLCPLEVSVHVYLCVLVPKHTGVCR